MKKIGLSVVATMLFVVVLFGVYYLHISYFRVNVVFYAAVVDSVIATLVLGVILFSIPFFNIIGTFEKVQIIFIWLLTGYAFAISVPTVIDRSLSFYILEKLQQRGGGIQIKMFKKVFTEEYVQEHRLVDVRLTEQLESGTIRIVDECVELTEKGDRLAGFSRFFRKNLLPKRRLLMGEYSDDLTDPFRHSPPSADYICR